MTLIDPSISQSPLVSSGQTATLKNKNKKWSKPRLSDRKLRRTPAFIPCQDSPHYCLLCKQSLEKGDQHSFDSSVSASSASLLPDNDIFREYEDSQREFASSVKREDWIVPSSSIEETGHGHSWKIQLEEKLVDPQTLTYNRCSHFESQADMCVHRVQNLNRLLITARYNVQNAFGLAEQRELDYHDDPFDGDPLPETFSIGCEWDLDILSFSQFGNDFPFLHIGYHLICRYAHPDTPSSMRQTFLIDLCSFYDPNVPYHGSSHGASVAHQLMSLVGMLTYDDILTSFEHLVLVCSALSHDAGHIGRNNAFLKSTAHPFSLLYNHSSPLERYSIAILNGILRSESGAILDAYGPLLTDRARADIANYILGTDMRHHVKLISEFNAKAAFSDPNRSDFIRSALVMCIKLADLGHCCLPWNVHIVWVLRVMTEFYNQSDEERHVGLNSPPFTIRKHFGSLPGDQVMFLSYVVLPLVSSVRYWCSQSGGTTYTNEEDHRKRPFEAKVSRQLLSNIYSWSSWQEALQSTPPEHTHESLKSLFISQLTNGDRSNKYTKGLQPQRTTRIRLTTVMDVSEDNSGFSSDEDSLSPTEVTRIATDSQYWPVCSRSVESYNGSGTTEESNEFMSFSSTSLELSS